MNLIERTVELAQEASDGINFFSNGRYLRDPRWGRVSEGRRKLPLGSQIASNGKRISRR
jgi:uncharacterized membrane protein